MKRHLDSLAILSDAVDRTESLIADRDRWQELAERSIAECSELSKQSRLWQHRAEALLSVAQAAQKLCNSESLYRIEDQHGRAIVQSSDLNTLKEALAAYRDAASSEA